MSKSTGQKQTLQKGTCSKKFFKAKFRPQWQQSSSVCGSKKGGGLQTCQEWVHPFNTSMTVKSSSFNPQLKVPQSKITNRLAFTCHTMIGMYSIRAFSGSFSHQTPFLFSIPLYVLSCIKWYSLVVQLLTINTSKIHTCKI